MDLTAEDDLRLRVETELRAYYDDEAEERARRALRGKRVDALSRFLIEIPDVSRSVLELGTGAGRDVRQFVTRGLRVFGVDLSVEQARHARLAGAHQVIASTRHLPFPAGAFSALWSMSTLMHVPNSAIRETLLEIRRVLAPRAVAGVGVWGGPDIEDYGNQDRGQHRRLFSRRSDESWQGLLELIGEISVYETWDEDADDFLVSVGTRPGFLIPPELGRL